MFLCFCHIHTCHSVTLSFSTGCSCEVVWLWLCQNWSRRPDDPSVHSLLRSTSGKEAKHVEHACVLMVWEHHEHIYNNGFMPSESYSTHCYVQVLEAQRRHQKEKSGIIPTSPTPYTYNKVTSPSSRQILRAMFLNLILLIQISLVFPQSCDLWSLGVIIYVMLCGYPPFYSKHHSRTIPKDMRKKIMTGSFDFPEDEWSQISEMAKDIVRK